MQEKKRYRKNLSKYEGLEGWEKLNFSQQLACWAKKYGDKVAVIDAEAEITYRELDHRASILAGAFLDSGIRQNDKVVVQLPNRISFVITFFALARAGAVPILALPAHREAELEGIINLAEPAAYIVAEKYMGYDYLPLAEKLKNKFDCLRTVVVDGEHGGDCLLSDMEGTVDNFPEVDCYEPGVLLLSGGTTGIPKLIPRTHTDYIYNARMSSARCRLNDHTVYLAALPVAHNFPLCCPGLLGTLDVGGTVILSPTTSPDDILSMISEEKVTVTGLVPAMVTMCMEMLQWDDDYDISSLKVLQVGGAMLEDSLADKIIAEWPCKLMQVFGTAEGLLCTTSLDDDNTIVARCQGTPVSPEDEVKIVDESDEEVTDGTYGELLSRGPYTIDGYYKAEEANQVSFTEDGFYRTGDKAMWTREGKIRMGGRIKEQINRAGEKIMPAEIEAYLCKHPNIKEAAVVGVPDEVMGNRICTFLMSADGNCIELAEIHQYLQGLGVASYKFPDQIENIHIWPLTSVGKIDKKELQKMAVK
ncbi:MAG: AMP-binding protein [Muricomes sp.]